MNKNDYKTMCNKCYIKTWYETEQQCHVVNYPGSRCTGTLKVIDNSKLDYRLTPFFENGIRVEVTWKKGFEDFTGYGSRTEGRKARFWIGKSMGWVPVYLQILTRRSTGGAAILSKAIESVRPIVGKR